MSTITNIIRRNRLISTLTATATVLALVPAGASAATTWFGSSLNHDPANAGSTCADDGVMTSSLCTHVGSFYPGTSGRAQSPATGTITTIKVLPQGPMTMRVKVVQVRNLSSDERSGQAKTVAHSRLIQVQGPSQTDLDNGTYSVESFPVHLKVKKGQEIAIDTSSNTAEYCSDGTPGQLLFGPVLGNQFRTSNGVDDCLMLVQAVVQH